MCTLSASCCNFARALCGPACCSGLIQQKPVMYIFDFTVFQVINVRTGCLDLHPFKLSGSEGYTCFMKSSSLPAVSHQLFHLWSVPNRYFWTFYDSHNVVIKRKKKSDSLWTGSHGEKNEWARRYWNHLHLFMTTDMKNDQILLVLFVFLVSCKFPPLSDSARPHPETIRLFSFFCL